MAIYRTTATPVVGPAAFRQSPTQRAGGFGLNGHLSCCADGKLPIAAIPTSRKHSPGAGPQALSGPWVGWVGAGAHGCYTGSGACLSLLGIVLWSVAFAPQ
jgi:hypothetical protein